MKKKIFIILARLNKTLLPSLTKKRVDIMQLSTMQKLVLAWKTWVTKNSLN